MNTKAFVIKTEGELAWLAPEPESCSICSADGVRHEACDACEIHSPQPFTARNTRGLALKPGMKVLAAAPQGRALAQGAASLGIPLLAALAGFLVAPASAKPLAALAALVVAALAVCGLSALIKRKSPRLYGEMEVAEILEEPAARFFPGAAGAKAGEISQTPLHSG